MAPFPSWRLCSVPHVKRDKLWQPLPLLLAQPRVVQGLVTAVMKLMKVVMMMMIMVMWGMTRGMPVEGAAPWPCTMGPCTPW